MRTCTGCGCGDRSACLLDRRACAWVASRWCTACEASRREVDHLVVLVEVTGLTPDQIPRLEWSKLGLGLLLLLPFVL
jgi:hypothetical protein